MTSIPVIDVLLVTYNQEAFIVQAIESVLSQAGEINFRLLIGEDCSTDMTGPICESYSKRYPEKITLIRNKKNLGLLRNYKKLFDESNAEYIAILEGDDFWCDDFKLRKQLDILENEREIGLVSTGLNVMYEDGTIKKSRLARRKIGEEGYMYTAMMKNHQGIPASITACFRREIMRKNFDFDYFIENDFKTLDAPLWLELSYHTKFKYLPDITATYRILSNSISNNREISKLESFIDTSSRTLRYYYRKYPIKGLSEKMLLSRNNFILIDAYLKAKEYKKARTLSQQIKLVRIKYILAWLASKSKVFVPVYFLNNYLIKSGSNILQFSHNLMSQIKKSIM